MSDTSPNTTPDASNEPEWLLRAVTLHDHFDAYTTLRIAQPQPQYGTVQLNATFKGTLISVDVNAADLINALHAVLNPPGDPSTNNPKTGADDA